MTKLLDLYAVYCYNNCVRKGKLIKLLESIMNIVYLIVMVVVSYLIVPAFILVMWSAIALFLMVFVIVAASGMKYDIEKSYDVLFGA